MFLASSEFADAADAQSRAIGLAVPYVLLPHPVQDRTDDELVTMADDAYGAVLAAVTQPADGS